MATNPPSTPPTPTPPQKSHGTLTLILMAVVAVATLAAGVYLISHGEKELGAMMIGSVVTAFFLHGHGTTTAAITSSNWEKALEQVGSLVVSAVTGQKNNTTTGG